MCKPVCHRLCARVSQVRKLHLLHLGRKETDMHERDLIVRPVSRPLNFKVKTRYFFRPIVTFNEINRLPLRSAIRSHESPGPKNKYFEGPLSGRVSADARNNCQRNISNYPNDKSICVGRMEEGIIEQCGWRV